MHIRDGFLSPEVCLATGLAATAAVGYSLHRLRGSLSERTVPLTGMMASLVFAGQMVNFPLPIPGVAISGHLLGGVLAATLLGPWGACVALALVLVVQLALFADGGWTVLGANVLNMAVLGGIGGYAVYAGIRRFLGTGFRGTVSAAVFAAWLSVVLGAALFTAEFRLSWPADAFRYDSIFALMTVIHSGIGIGEALITGLVVSFVYAQRPDLLSNPAVAPRASAAAHEGWRGKAVVVGIVASLVVAACLAPWASSFSDGLDTVAERTGFSALERPFPPLLLEDYAVPLPAGSWESLAVSLAGIGGAIVVLLMAWLLGLFLVPAPSAAEAPHAG